MGHRRNSEAFWDRGAKTTGHLYEALEVKRPRWDDGSSNRDPETPTSRRAFFPLFRGWSWTGSECWRELHFRVSVSTPSGPGRFRERLTTEVEVRGLEIRPGEIETTPSVRRWFHSRWPGFGRFCCDVSAALVAPSCGQKLKESFHKSSVVTSVDREISFTAPTKKL